MNKATPIVVLLALALLALFSSLVVIDETEIAIVTQFGEYKRTIDTPGLHFKIPFLQQVNRMERRIILSDNPPSSYLTKDKKRLVVDPITRWRIADPLKFFTTVRDEVGAKARLDDTINSELRRELASNDFGAVVCVPGGAQRGTTEADPRAPGSAPPEDADALGTPHEDDTAEEDPQGTDAKEPPDAAASAIPGAVASAVPSASAGPPAPSPPPKQGPQRAAPAPRERERATAQAMECGRESVMALVTKRVVEQSERYGIQVVDVQIKRTDLPTEVQESVFQRMRAERERVAKRYRSEGEEEAQKIRAETDKEVRLRLAAAYEKAQRARGRGDAESISVYAEAYGKDPEFYAFTRSLETYEQVVGKGSSVVLSTGSPLFKYLEEPTAK